LAGVVAASTYNRFAGCLQRRPELVNRKLSNVPLLIETPHWLDHNVDKCCSWVFLMAETISS